MENIILVIARIFHKQNLLMVWLCEQISFQAYV